MMEPLRITAELCGRLVPPREGYVHLDGLLAWAVWQLSCDPPALDETQLVRHPIPVAESACGRYHLASASVYRVRQHEKRWLNKRFPISEWQMLGAGKTSQRIQLTAGPSKSLHVPVAAVHLVDNLMEWWCVGERDEIVALLEVVTHVGRLRGHGEGEVRRWSVEPCEPWGPGFPVVDADGRPLRHLPEGDPLVTGECLRRVGVVTYPYYVRSREEVIAAPRPW